MTPSFETIAACWHQLRSAVTNAQLWYELAEAYKQQQLDWQAAYSARQAVRCEPSRQTQLNALNLNHWQDATAGDAVLGRAVLLNADSLITRFTEAINTCPGDWLSHLYLTRLHELAGQQPLASSHLAHALSLEVIPGETQHWLGVWRLNAGDAQGSVNALFHLVDLRPLRHGSMMYLGEALLRIGNKAAAEKAFTRASLSNNPDFLTTLATKVYANNYWQEALAVLQKAIDLRPNHVATWLALAKIQAEVYELAACRESLRRIKHLQPDHPELALLEAGLHGRMGDAEAHFTTLQNAYQNKADPLSRLASSIAMTALYQDNLTPLQISELHQRLCAPITQAVSSKALSKNQFNNPRVPHRRLRIGYVTGDLHRQHPVNLFLLPILMRHDPQRVAISIYHTGFMQDDYTLKAKQCADYWLDAAHLDDTSLQHSIINDQIDILIDLAGHTSSHRLGVFAPRAAPVQATFLGYPYSTGLSTMDWLIGDAIVTPADHQQLYCEGLAQLPGSVFCWAPVDDYPLTPARPKHAPLVFGSFNNAMKLTPKTLTLWAQVLHAIPNAQLLLKAPSLKDSDVQKRFSALFAEQGIAPQRIQFRGPSELSQMMQEYGDIDFALDPTPYNGGTTTMQALWMGVPVVSLLGSHFVSRMGASFLHSLNQSNWLAENDRDYVDIAVKLAEQHLFWRERRQDLRAQMLASPLATIDAYVAKLELLYQRMWLDYCANEQQNVKLLRVE